MIEKILTQCCALAQISASNDTTVGELSDMIGDLKRQAYEKNHYGTENNLGQRAAFCITTPTEDALVLNLKKFDFKHVFTFPRRQGYPAGELKMWVKNW